MYIKQRMPPSCPPNQDGPQTVCQKWVYTTDSEKTLPM